MNLTTDTPARFPFPSYPTGWFAVAFSRDLEPGDVKPIRNFGKELVIYRTESGRPVVADPYCPHLGAHLGHGGVVEGENIRCPFHFWKFEPGGKCVEVPFAQPSPKAAIKIWPTVEKNGVVLVWHDMAGRAPLWDMPEYEPTDFPELADFALFEGIRSHPQEILENSPDWLHLMSLHGTRRLFGEAEAFKTEPHVMAYRYRTKEETPDPSPMMGHFNGESWLEGPGLVRNLNWGHMAPGVMVENAVYPTPVDAETLQIRAAYRIVAGPGSQAPREVLQQIFAVVGPEILRLLEQDFVIWANKAYLPRPMLAASDGPILKFRKWYSQFYPEGFDQPEALTEMVA